MNAPRTCEKRPRQRCNMQLLTWKLGDQKCGMQVDECKEVVFADRITVVPAAAPHVAGIINIRGDVVTVVDLRVLLGYDSKPAQQSCTVIRLRGKSGQFGVRADIVSDVFEV